MVSYGMVWYGGEAQIGTEGGRARGRATTAEANEAAMDDDHSDK